MTAQTPPAAPATDPTQTDLTKEYVDPLLDCLVYLTAHFGRAKSAQALTAGLAYDARGMGPLLFCEAAERLGLRTRIARRGRLKSISSAALPVVLLLKNNQACILLGLRGKTAKIYLPETEAERSE